MPEIPSTTPAINGFYNRGRQDQFLSNFFFTPFILNVAAISHDGPSPVAHLAGRVAPTVEHFFQAAKVLDAQQAAAIMAAATAADAKRLGRKAALRADWESVKQRVMKDILRAKFSDAQLLAKLLATGNAELIEANHWHDTIWGVCTCPKHGNTGQNRLGRILMELRTEYSTTA